jgi:hypothetical protein
VAANAANKRHVAKKFGRACRAGGPWFVLWARQEGANAMHSIVPCLWFGNRAEEALEFYLSVFPKEPPTAA